MQGRTNRGRFSPTMTGEIATVSAAIQSYGRLRFARDMGLWPNSVDNWKFRGVPAERVLEVETLLAIPREKIRPDIYEELPKERKKELLRLREAGRKAAVERLAKEKKRATA